MTVDSDRFRRLFGAFPTPVSVVTTLDVTGQPRGFTCTAWSAVSLSPPLLLVCLNKQARTAEALRGHGAFAVNVLGEGGETVARVFAGTSTRKFAGVPWLPGSAAGGAPLLSDVAVAQAECTVIQVIDAGDHWIVVGRVEEAAVFARAALLHHHDTYRPWEDSITRTSGG